ncbi:hypothetical protein HDV57DRAFT_178030 [Trichoderma longibrachiatum]
MRALRFSCRQKYCYYYLDRSSQGTAYAVRSTSHSQPVMWALPGGPGAKIWGNGMPSMSSPCGALVLAPPGKQELGVCFLPGAKPASFMKSYADDTQKCILETRRRLSSW